MKSPITTLALAVLGGLAAGPAWGQADPAAAKSKPRSPLFSTRATPEPATRDGRVLRSGSMVPEPTPADEIKPPSIALPQDPVEPFLLTKENGPFMVLAKVFRGPDSQKMALALVLELRQQYHLPAFILRSKDYPGKSNVRNIPPTADPSVSQANVTMTAKVRTYDEAAVLVGEAKTLKDQERLLHEVKKIKPKCLDGMPKLYNYVWREGLSKAIRTTNPMVAAQYLYPKKMDRLIVQMNSTAWSISHCPARYTLQVAEFAGRSTFDVQDANFQGNSSLKSSPLRTAAEDAEKMAAKLAKDPLFQKLGQPIYVYHDRTASRVFVGAFNIDRDPVAVEVRENLLKSAVELMDRKRPTGGLDTMIVPAAVLTDLKDIKANFQ